MDAAEFENDTDGARSDDKPEGSNPARKDDLGVFDDIVRRKSSEPRPPGPTGRTKPPPPPAKKDATPPESAPAVSQAAADRASRSVSATPDDTSVFDTGDAAESQIAPAVTPQVTIPIGSDERAIRAEAIPEQAPEHLPAREETLPLELPLAPTTTSRANAGAGSAPPPSVSLKQAASETRKAEAVSAYSPSAQDAPGVNDGSPPGPIDPAANTSSLPGVSPAARPRIPSSASLSSLVGPSSAPPPGAVLRSGMTLPLPPPPPPSSRRASSPVIAPALTSAAPPGVPPAQLPASPAPSTPPASSPLGTLPSISSTSVASRTIPPRYSDAALPTPSLSAPAAGVRGGGRVLLGTAVLAILVVAAVGFFFLWPTRGRIVVIVAGPGGRAVDNVRVVLDNERECIEPPCTFSGLSPEVHTIKVEAPGYTRRAGQAVPVRRGQDEVVSIELTPETGTHSQDPAAASPRAGLEVPALAAALRLSVDGQDRGPLPAKVEDLAPGEHVVRLEGNDRYLPHEAKLVLEPSRTTTYRPTLIVQRGELRIEAGENSTGARVTLSCPGKKTTTLKLPISVDVDPAKPCTIAARRPAFEEFSTLVDFADGAAEKSITVNLTKASEGEPRAAAQAVFAPGRQPQDRAPQPAAQSASSALMSGRPAQVPPPGEAPAKGRIAVSSTPPGMAVVVAGRPSGRTPVVLEAPAGTQTVIIIDQASGQRKVLQVQVQPGQTAAAAASF